MTANRIAQLQQQLASETGLCIDLLRNHNMTGFMKRRCQELGLEDDCAYLRLAIGDGSERERLVNEVSVPETWFFRYPASFELLIDRCRRLREKGQQKLRMLSIACATGEEPYGMAMAAVQAGWSTGHIHIDASDRNEASLAFARHAAYRDISFRESMPTWAAQWFHRTQDHVQVDPSIVSCVHFSRRDILNATSRLMPEMYDIVFCRNLFIYLGGDARTSLLRLLVENLSPGGLLFVGHAEVPISAGAWFEPAAVRHCFALQAKPTTSDLPQTGLQHADRQHPDANRPGRKQPSEHPAMGVSGRAAGQSQRRPNRAVQKRTRDVDSDSDREVGYIGTLNAARQLADAGRLNEALDVLQTIAPPPTADTDYFELLGTLRLTQGQIHEAREAFRKVIYIKHDHEDALLQLASISEQLGNPQQASRFRKRATLAHRRKSGSSPETGS